MNQKTDYKALDFPDEPLCNTCKKRIEFFPYRHITISGQNNISQIVFFHYFFPCYDLNYIMINHPTMPILEAGFTFDSDFIPNIRKTRNFIKNLDLWVSDGY